ncbi:proline-rich protein HaeIII subfamily 1-like [Malurus melanocephalus]|uniref:proline-rich protein HaeIII subfamily 1-like n=1 Tax=Malurus melanocephalus TaxID=175006 RepID=UPI002546EF1F|nr:proline-rich protein HaeIII subfamily 1-like [Malurus melanocephalus]
MYMSCEESEIERIFKTFAIILPFHPAALAPAAAQSGAPRTYQKSHRSPQAAPSPAGAERDPAPPPQLHARPRPQGPPRAVPLALAPVDPRRLPPPGWGRDRARAAHPPGPSSAPPHTPRQARFPRRGRVRFALPHPDIAEPQRLRRAGTDRRNTHPPPPRPPPPGSPHLRHVPARPPPPAYLPRASPTPASARSASPIGGQNNIPPAQLPLLHFDCLALPPLNEPPAFKHAPNGAALRGALSLVDAVAGSAR